MKTLVCGGRDFEDRACVFAELDRLHDGIGVTLIIHGACVNAKTKRLQGADRWAEEWAIEREVPYVGHPAPWATLGNRAGPVRNGNMLLRWEPEVVVAFPGGRGTADMVRRAVAKNIDVLEVNA